MYKKAAQQRLLCMKRYVDQLGYHSRTPLYHPLQSVLKAQARLLASSMWQISTMQVLVPQKGILQSVMWHMKTLKQEKLLPLITCIDTDRIITVTEF